MIRRHNPRTYRTIRVASASVPKRFFIQPSESWEEGEGKWSCQQINVGLHNLHGGIRGNHEIAVILLTSYLEPQKARRLSSREAVWMYES
jgi:hypothetical protein